METALPLTKPQQVAHLSKVGNDKEAVRKVVTISANGAEFGVDTKLIRNVIQVADASLIDDGQAMMLSSERIPVFSLRDLINDEMAATALEAEAGRTILIVRSASSQQSLAIRVDSVSRPIVVFEHSFYRLPSCVYSDQKNEFIESLALIKTETDEKVELRLVIDPLKAFGLDDQQNQVNQAVGHLEGVVVGDTSRSKGQIVVFSPAGTGGELAFQFCLPLPFMAEIIQTNEKSVLPLPMALPKVTGMVMWRGIPVPIINLADQFHVDCDASDLSDSRLMICHLGQGQHVGFYTQAQIRTIRTPNSTQTDVDWLFGMPKLAAVESADGVLVVPDLKSILTN